MKFTYVNISHIIKAQRDIIKKSRENKWVFIYIPLILGCLFTLLFYNDNESILNTLTLFISIFIPIFVNLLSILITFVMNKIKTRHNKERIPLIKQTFYSICYLIPVSLLLIALSLFLRLTLFEQCVLWEIPVNFLPGYFFTITITINTLIRLFFGIFFYGFLVHLIMIILMVTKRIFKLFDKEIDLLSSDNE